MPPRTAEATFAARTRRELGHDLERRAHDRHDHQLRDPFSRRDGKGGVGTVPA
jgi:hypothetical protein